MRRLSLTKNLLLGFGDHFVAVIRMNVLQPPVRTERIVGPITEHPLDVFTDPANSSNTVIRHRQGEENRRAGGENVLKALLGLPGHVFGRPQLHLPELSLPVIVGNAGKKRRMTSVRVRNGESHPIGRYDFARLEMTKMAFASLVPSPSNNRDHL